MSAPTFDDIFQAGKFEILRRPTRFSPAIVDTDGSDVNVVVAAGASMADEVSHFAQNVFNELHLSTAIRVGGEVLDHLVWDWYQLIRYEAQNSVVSLVFSRPSALSPVSIPSGTVVSSDDGQTFETVNGVVMGVGVLGPVTVTGMAQIAGELGNVESGAIRTIVSGLTDIDMEVTNDEPAAGGGPEETDEQLGQRARDHFSSIRRGTRAAILTGCLATPGVSQATVTEDLNSLSYPNFRVQAIISDENGQANGALATRVLDNLEDYRALGVPARVISGTPQFVEILIEGITFRAGANTTRLVDQLRAQVVSRVNQLAPSQTLRRSTIFSALRISDIVDVPESALVEPSGDLVPSGSSGVIRTTASRVSINGRTGGS